MVLEKYLALNNPSMPEFVAADIVADANILEVAKDEAQSLWHKKIGNYYLNMQACLLI